MMPKAPDCRSAGNPWPEWPKVNKTDYGQEEAITIFGHDPRIFETTVTEFMKDKKGRLKGVKTVRLNRKFEKIEGSEKELPAEIVLIAAGFLGSESYVTDACTVEVTARNNVATKEGSYATSVPNIYTAGDMHRGQSLVVWAIAEGRAVAKEVDESLMGYSNL